MASRSNGSVDLTVADDGIGFPASLDPRETTSLGLELVFTFAEQLGAAVTIERAGGTRFRFTFAYKTGSPASAPQLLS